LIGKKVAMEQDKLKLISAIKGLIILVLLVTNIALFREFPDNNYVSFIVSPTSISLIAALVISIHEDATKRDLINQVLDERSFKETLGLERVFPIYSDCYQEIYEGMAKTNEMTICVSHGHNFTANRSANYIKYFSAAKSKIVLVIMDPCGAKISEFSERFGIAEDSFRERIYGTVKLLLDAATDSSASRSSALDVYFHNAPQSYASYQLDNTMFYCPFYIGNAGSSAPAVKLNHRDSDETSLFSLLREDMAKVIGKCEHVASVKKSQIESIQPELQKHLYGTPGQTA